MIEVSSSTLIFPSNKKGIVPLNNRVRKNVFGLVPCIHGARLSESARTAGKTTQELLDFSVNINPLEPPKLRSILSAACKDINNYPDNRYPGFKKAAADYLKVSSENIVPGNGSSELIRLFAETVIEPEDKVIIPAPTFSEYEFQCRLLGARIENVNYDDILNTDIDNCKAVFLCNPNNPTGKLLDRKQVRLFAEKCSCAEVFLFVDEAFIELSDPRESIADVAACNDFVIVLRSLTKTFAIPGLRIGFAVASPVLADLMNKSRLHWNMNSIAAAVGENLLKCNQDYINRSLELLKKERKWLTSKLAGVRGFKPYPSDTNFILIDLREFGLSSADLTGRMLRHGIIIRDCASFNLENHIRVAVRKRNENRRLIAGFLSVIKEWGSELAEKEIGKALDRGVAARSRIDCEYYPCHFEGQDCTFCFCPFYPCENTRTGGELIHRSTGGTVWSCAGCNLIHQGHIAEKVLKELMSCKKIKDVWKHVMEPVL
ncbi:MAG: histidinol-phosphate aminotransferase [Candidatus Methanoperedens nitroreducens]|uniref:threonine-phosphate decarboxylase n=1 Tax=Candidatus Methanoperedens nitratireducens TaxID=1392998 RepID=A0A0P8AD78_9EURY|nr:threonine-phosphate decarboxylase CobD [Candidatus Methanoperedens sp. BLZ2]KAB2943745.1 MAG: threonine-phosphate decarboxylase [Candidatus Methanoperedens sp.]KPQ42101.1 MAG: histidinol-phosphate aminotransferase [Candidatus Methanoperedens sp. BLZ1]MBZ0174702.1 threonine-phosphate decarboxylase CobD [Candidatus Methanoperedens nitroreducens]CAG1002163.1 threonine-phosphate decarboxylase [Methanosarcinales archaeon]